jgi:predicted porin
VKISAGETAKFIHAGGLGTQPTGTYANPESFDITEAYISYTAPIGKGLRIDLGKMVTYFGAEVIEAVDNPNYSSSFLFNYAIPFTHTGVKASYVFNDNVNASFHVVNGWDNATDNNTGKCFGTSINISAGDPFSAYINYMQGPEGDNNNHDNRSLLDLVATIKPLKPLSIILNYDNGKQDNAGAASAKWDGFAAIVKYDINDMYSLSLRGESFDDKDGTRVVIGTPQKLTEVTITPEIRLANGLIVRPEYRHDSSDKQSFDNGTKKTQDTIALGMMYRW